MGERPPSEDNENKTEGRYVRWQRATREQLGTTVSVVLTLATAVLGFAASLFVGKDAVPFHGRALGVFWVSGIILAFSAFCGLRVHWTRLLDFRWTARAVRLEDLIARARGKERVRWPGWLGELEKLRQPSLLARSLSWYFPSSPLLSGEDVAVVNEVSVAASVLLGHPSTMPAPWDPGEIVRESAEIAREFCRDQAERFGRETWGWLPWQFGLFLLGVLFILTSIIARGSSPTPTPDKSHTPISTFGQTVVPPAGSGKPQNCPSAELASGCCCQVISPQPAQSPSPVASASRLLVPLALLTGLIIVAGLLVLLFGSPRLGRTLGAVTLLGGLTGTGTFIHEVKIDNLLKVDIGADVRAELKKLGPFGSEYLGYVKDFDPGRPDIKPETGATINAVCTTWKNRVHGENRGLLLVVGATDRVPLSPSLRRQYESNVGLAQARAEAVRRKITECGVPNTEMLALVSGPRNTPESRTPPSGYPGDRRVDIWGLWGWASTEYKSGGLQTSVEIKTQRDDRK